LAFIGHGSNDKFNNRENESIGDVFKEKNEAAFEK
jgi:hypothetical protein